MTETCQRVVAHCRVGAQRADVVCRPGALSGVFRLAAHGAPEAPRIVRNW